MQSPKLVQRLRGGTELGHCGNGGTLVLPSAEGTEMPGAVAGAAVKATWVIQVRSLDFIQSVDCEIGGHRGKAGSRKPN